MSWKKIIAMSIIFFLLLIPLSLILQIYNLQIVSAELQKDEVLQDLRDKFDRTYNYTEIFQWEHSNLNFSWGDIERHTNPIEILEYGEGRCGEFAILFVGLCLAHGYETRLVANIFGDHMWAQIKIDDEWTHFDPSLSLGDNRTNDRFLYEREWKSTLLFVIAFENSTFEDVTNTYRSGFWVNILSVEMLMFLLLTLFLLFSILTFSKVREAFYKLSFKKDGIKNTIGSFYEKNLHTFYVLRFFFLFFLPLSIKGIFFAPITQNELLNLLLGGSTLVVFSALEMPQLSKPKAFVSVIQDCVAVNCQYSQKNKKEDKDCKYEKDKVCKHKERFLEVKEKKGTVLFRIANLNLHILKNCSVFFTFPGSLKPIKYTKDNCDTVDFGKKYYFQERNNACYFSPKDNYLTVPPGDCMCIPIDFEVVGQVEKEDCIKIELVSESTWGGFNDKIALVSLMRLLIKS